MICAYEGVDMTIGKEFKTRSRVVQNDIEATQRDLVSLQIGFRPQEAELRDRYQAIAPD